MLAKLNQKSRTVGRSAAKRLIGIAGIIFVSSLLVAAWHMTGSTIKNHYSDGESSVLADSATKPKLRWRPPVLTEPVTINVAKTVEVQSLRLDNSKDYVISLPAAEKIPGIILIGGRNIMIIGGHIEVPAHDPADKGYRAVTIRDGNDSGIVDGRIIHIEGVLITAAGEGDAFGIAAPSAIIQLQNIRAVDLHGHYDRSHADVIQPYGGVKELRIDRFTGASNYNNLYFRRENNPLGPEIGTVRISNTNIYGYNNPAGHNPASTLNTISLGTQPAGDDNSETVICELTNPVYFDEFYGTPPPGVSLGKFVWPPSGGSRSCRAEVAPDGMSVDWPLWRGSKVFGIVKLGPPPSGDFVKETDTGLGYVSPGYVTDEAPADTTPPTVPAEVTAVAGDSQVTVSWEASTDDTAVASYTVRHRVAGATTWTNITDITDTSYTLTGLENGTSYEFQVRAKDATDNRSTYSKTVTATPVATAKEGDIDGDGDVDADDLSQILRDYGLSSEFHPRSDINGDGLVDAFDLSRVIFYYGS